MDDYGDDEYYDGSDDADLGDMLTLPRQREERENDGVSISSDDVGSDVISLSDDDRKSSVVDTLLEDFEKFRKMNKEKEKFKVILAHLFTWIMIIYDNLCRNAVWQLLSRYLRQVVAWFSLVANCIIRNRR